MSRIFVATLAISVPAALPAQADNAPYLALIGKPLLCIFSASGGPVRALDALPAGEGRK